MRTKAKRILALLLLSAMAVTWIPAMVAASDEEASASVAVTDVEDSAQEAQTPEEAQIEEEPAKKEEPEPLDVDLSSGRILVDSGNATIVPEDAPVLGGHDGIYLLQYDTVEQAEDAYREFSELAKSVEVDIPFSLADEEETPVAEEEAMTEVENPIAILEQQIEEAEPVAEPKVIALIDSGTVLSDNVIARYSVIDDDPADYMGHGTKMLETIVEQNPKAQVISIKAFDENGKGTVSSVYAAIQLAIELKVDFINLSAYAKVTEESAVISGAIRDAVARGITFVGAAGNDGADVKDYIPGSISEATIVGAADENGNRASFSNYGDTVDYWKTADSTSVAAAMMTGILSRDEVDEEPEEPSPEPSNPPVDEPTAPEPSEPPSEEPTEPEPSEPPAEEPDVPVDDDPFWNDSILIRNVLATSDFPEDQGLAYLSEHPEYYVWMFTDTAARDGDTAEYEIGSDVIDMVAFNPSGCEISAAYDSGTIQFEDAPAGKIVVDVLYKQAAGVSTAAEVDSDFSLAVSITEGETTTVHCDMPISHSPPYPFATWQDETKRTDQYGNKYTSDLYCLSGGADWGVQIASTNYAYGWSSTFGQTIKNPKETTLNNAGGVKVLVYILAKGKYRGSDATWTPHFNSRTYSVLGSRGSWLEYRNSCYGGDCVNGKVYSGDKLWLTTQLALWNFMSAATTGTYMMKTDLANGSNYSYFGIGSNGEEFMTLIQGGALALISEAIQWAQDGGTFDEEMQYIYDSIYFISANNSGSYSYYGHAVGSSYAQDMMAFRPWSPPPTGDLKLIKKSSDSNVSVSGWEFTFKNTSTGETVTKKTGSDGTITLTGLASGAKYTVTEKTYPGYVTPKAQTVTIESGKTNTVTFTNAPLKGNLTVTKAVNYGTKAGFVFHLKGTSTIGKTVNLTATTDSTGTAKFTGVYVGTYTLSEDDPGSQYIKMADQTVTITANETTGAAYTATARADNVWKYWYANITKVDAETGKSSNAMDGAEYTLYQNGKAVKVYTIKNGKFTTDEYPCTESDSVYTLKETKAPAGYSLNSTTYKLTTSYTHYTNKVSSFNVTVEDAPVKGKFQIEKWAVNTVSKDKKPEKGATFEVYLKSAGSYAKADDAHRDMITIGADGKGTSKDLPYGVYCIRQKTGWAGYELDTKVYEATISENGATVTKDNSKKDMKFQNDIWTGTLTIVKVDKDSRTPLAGAEFELKGSDGSKKTATTGANGKVEFKDLVYGVTYEWQETKAPHGYVLDTGNKGIWSVEAKDATIEVTAEDVRRPGTIIVTKQDTNGEPLSGAVFKLEYQDGSTWKPVSGRKGAPITRGGCTSSGLVEGQLTTGDSGSVSFEGLWADGEIQYRLTEVKAPEGYELLKEPVYEGTLPVAVELRKATGDPDEVDGNTAYFYTLPLTVKDGKVFNLPHTGGHGSTAKMALTIIAFGMGLIILTMKPHGFRRTRRSKSH